jgi:circadian clock protein KaiC
VRKKSTGIEGLDDITGGGLPEQGLTAVIGGPGAGKTVFALQTIVNRLIRYEEPAIFVTFEEPEAQIWRHAASFTWGAAMLDLKKIQVLDARLPIDVVGSGDFDLSALLAGLSAIVEESGARNIVFDGIDVLLSGLAKRTSSAF